MTRREERDRMQAQLSIEQINDVLSRVNDPVPARRTGPFQYLAALQDARAALSRLI